MPYNTIYLLFTILLIIISFLPLVPSQNWLFRICDFGRIQLMALQLIMLVVAFLLPNYPTMNAMIIQLLLMIASIENIVLLAPYFPYKKNLHEVTPEGRQAISIISANVYQPNQDYQKLFSYINDLQPDIFFTMETNADWEKALSIFDNDYPYHKKLAYENTYGMHFYSKLKINDCKVNYFMADDVPSFHITLTNTDGEPFTFLGVHPPPPSPTEEPNSKERDGELIKIGELAKKCKTPVVVMGDFNNVAWSKSAILFKKISGLVDPRSGRGFIPTYHARYWLLRFPIDLCFHSNNVVIQDFKTLGKIGSDHLPLYCKFFIKHQKQADDKNSESLSNAEQNEAHEMVEEGKKEEGEREG